jgi:uncharacterized membrane protein
MTTGPVELILIGFSENRFTGEAASALADLVDKGLIRVIDLVFVTKSEDGVGEGIELTGVDDDTRAAFEPLVDELTGLISEEDIEDLTDALDPGTSAAVLLFENVWAAAFADAVRNVGGELLFSMRVPHEVVEAATTT